jgi:DNA-binding NtrC family response regulator
LALPRTEVGRARPGVLVVHSDSGVPRGAYLVAKQCRLGRSDDCEIVLDDGKVSREHARIVSEPSGLWLEDLGSRNGTFLDGEPVKERVRVAAGSIVRVGRSLLLVVENFALLAGYPSNAGPPLIGGPALDPVRVAIAEVARSKSPIFIDGETGTGKEVTAELVHRSSGRSGAFVTLNCASLPAELVESELFGHKRGAFSGSDRAREGLFRAADQGTLFLDELGELSPEVQTKLLRALDSGEVRPVGDDQPVFVDVRVVAATNRDPEAMVAEGKLREDLFHRIAALRVTLPPLRERREDIPLLVAHFLQEAAQPDVLAMERLLLHDWPGNVRELRHAVEVARARAQAQGGSEIQAEHVPEPRLSARKARPSASDADASLRARIETALSIRTGNMTQVARDLGMSRSTLYEAVDRLGIDPVKFRT